MAPKEFCGSIFRHGPGLFMGHNGHLAYDAGSLPWLGDEPKAPVGSWDLLNPTHRTEHVLALSSHCTWHFHERSEPERQGKLRVRHPTRRTLMSPKGFVVVCAEPGPQTEHTKDLVLYRYFGHELGRPGNRWVHTTELSQRMHRKEPYGAQGAARLFLSRSLVYV